MNANGLALGEVANFVTDYFLLKIKFLAKRKREITTKFAILPNACWAFGVFILHFFILPIINYILDFILLKVSCDIFI